MNIEQTSSQQATRNQWSRSKSVVIVVDFEKKRTEISQREFSREEQIPRSTLQYWLERKSRIDSDPEIIRFFESPVGLAFLHRLVVCLHFIFTKVGVASSYNVSEFLKMTHLSAFVAASPSSQQRDSRQLDRLLAEFSAEEIQRLAVKMPEKRITLCEDETFHPDICMVAMEPVSNFILTERYTEDRTGATCNKVIY